MCVFYSKCSAKCSQGIKKRDVNCIRITKEGHILNETISKCKEDEKPASVMPCNNGECKGKYFWKTKHWTEVRAIFLITNLANIVKLEYNDQHLVFTELWLRISEASDCLHRQRW